MSAEEFVSIIIVNYNKRTLLKKCLDSIVKNIDYPHYEVIVIDNGSTDGSAQMVEKDFPWVKLVVNEKNLGFCKANNQGIEASKGEVIFLLNNDCIIQRGVVREMVKVLMSNKKIGIVGCKLIFPDGNLQSEGQSFPKVSLLNLASRIIPSLRSRITLSVNKYVHEDGNSLKYCEWILGAALMTKRSVIKKVGLLDEDYFIRWDDADYCYRCRKCGFEVVCMTDVQVIHVGGATVSLSFLLERNKLLFFVKNYPLREVVKAIVLLNLLSPLILSIIGCKRRDLYTIRWAFSMLEAPLLLKRNPKNDV